MSHAILSASGAKRWMECPPSARLEELTSESSSTYADEGSFVHTYAETLLSEYLKTDESFSERIKVLQENQYYSIELLNYVDDYVSKVIEKINEAKAKNKNVVVFLEQKLDYSKWVPEGFGTGDVVIVSDEAIEIIDLKYGKGIQVYAENNPQLRLYGLGACEALSFLYDFDTVNMTIIQPRLDHISTESMSLKDLLSWADAEVKPRAELAFAGKGDFRCGEHCRFCRVKATCKARAEYNLELAKYDFRNENLLTSEEIVEILGRVDELTMWASGIKDYAFMMAVKEGVKWDGWKLVEGRSNRKITDEKAVADTLLGMDYDELQIFNKKLKGLGDLEKLLGKKGFEKTLKAYVVKPQGKPALVPESDKRPELNSINSAEIDFQEEYID